MLNKQIFRSLTYCLFLGFILLISCKSNAYQSNISEQFHQTLLKVKALKDANPNAALALLNTATTYVDQLSIIDQLKFHKFQSEIYMDLSRFQLAKDVASYGLELAKRLKIPSILIAKLSYIRGFSIENLGDLNLANEDYLNGLDIAQSLNDQNVIAQGLINIGAIYYQTNRYDQSLTVLNDALKIASTLDDEDLKGFVNTELGILYAYIDEQEQSLKFYQQAYQHYQNAKKPSYALNAQLNIALNYLENKHYIKAITTYKKIITNLKKTGNKQFYYNAYMGLTWCYLRKKDKEPETAYQYMLIAEQYLSGVEQHQAVLSFYIDKGFVLEGLKRYDEALDVLFKAEKLITSKQRHENASNYLAILRLKADIYHALGHFETAYQYLSDYTQRNISLLKNEQMDVIQDIRLRYESEQSELQRKLLEKKRATHILELTQTETKTKHQREYFFFVLLLLIAFAWLLVKLIIGQRTLVKMSRTDDLTGLINRRRLMQLGQQFYIAATKQKLALSLLIIDVDFFKNINDKYGHKKGDWVLKTLAKLGQDTLRDDDVFARFGGEEFIILFPHTAKQQAVDAAERLRMIVNDHQWGLADNDKITISIGVASLEDGHCRNLNELIKCADDLLYQAKANGRNKVCVQ